MNFIDLHNQETPIQICNVWDVASAQAAQKLNYQVIGTSSGAIATMLGYNDGEEMSFEELKYIVERIAKSVDLPLSVDLEAGYSRNPEKIAEHIHILADLGVVGINIEDSIVTEGKREILDSDTFSNTLNEVCAILSKEKLDVFINVRTDTFLLGVPNPISETIDRAKKYLNAGGQGLFVPCIEKETDIDSVIQNIELPLNVMCMPNLPSFNVLNELGVKRISMGNFVYNQMNTVLERELGEILENGSFAGLFG